MKHPEMTRAAVSDGKITPRVDGVGSGFYNSFPFLILNERNSTPGTQPFLGWVLPCSSRLVDSGWGSSVGRAAAL